MTGSGRRRDDAENYEGVADNVNYSVFVKPCRASTPPFK